MSTNSFSARRQIWSNRQHQQHPHPHPHPTLRKQRSLIDDGGDPSSSSTAISGRSNSVILGRIDRGRYSTTGSSALLQKQFSIERFYSNRNLGRFNNRYNNNNNNCDDDNNNNNNRKKSLVRQVSIDGTRTGTDAGGGSGTVNNQHWSFRNNECSSEFGLSVIIPKKKVPLNLISYGEIKRDKIVGDRFKKVKGGEDRINLKIFLTHTAAILTENEGFTGAGSSDLDSQPESLEVQPILEKNHRNPIEKSNQETSVNGKHQEIVQFKRPISAGTRRAQFRASRIVQNSIGGGSLLSGTPSGNPAGVNSGGGVIGVQQQQQQQQQSNIPSPNLNDLPSSLTIERRSPLVRAMSAPIRTLDENSKNIFANNIKRKARRRKILSRTPSISNVIETIDENNENNSTIEKSGRATKNSGKKSSSSSSGRAKSATPTCDIVTLVSLLSSEGSDSEKEDILPPTTVDVPLRRAPLLRKTGKSVSFQENDSTNFIGHKEYPQILRRGSIAPLAARIRSNRPPTAPPVSIFVPKMDESESKIANESSDEIPEEDDTLNTSSTYEKSSSELVNCKDDADESFDNKTDETNEKQFPKYIKSLKERECWKLFQKMTNKGITVSYDTILRGMLTPTELRVLQKQKEIEESKTIVNETKEIDEIKKSGKKL